VLRTGDYSCGLFLYRFAIQRFLVFTFDWTKDPLLNGFASLTLTGAAALSTTAALNRAAGACGAHHPETGRPRPHGSTGAASGGCSP